MRISDWSSDVCSSDLTAVRHISPASSANRASSTCIPMVRKADKACSHVCMMLGSIGKAPPRSPSQPTRLPFQRSEEHTSELQSLMRISYAVFCLKKKKHNTHY